LIFTVIVIVSGIAVDCLLSLIRRTHTIAVSFAQFRRMRTIVAGNLSCSSPQDHKRPVRYEGQSPNAKHGYCCRSVGEADHAKT
jgi:hypothetical protein